MILAGIRSHLTGMAARNRSLALIVAALVSGCVSSEATKSGNSSVRGAAKGGLPSAQVDEKSWGRVASVNPSLRFVVMDFPLRRMPELDQRLNVYRSSQKVGEVKVTGPVMGTTIAGDIVAGEAQLGDEVRED